MVARRWMHAAGTRAVAGTTTIAVARDPGDIGRWVPAHCLRGHRLAAPERRKPGRVGVYSVRRERDASRSTGTWRERSDR